MIILPTVMHLNTLNYVIKQVIKYKLISNANVLKFSFKILSFAICLIFKNQ